MRQFPLPTLGAILPFLVATCAAVAIIGMAFPYGFPLFSLMVFVLIGATLLRLVLDGQIMRLTGESVLYPFLFMLLLLAYAFAWIMSGGQTNFVIDADYKTAIGLAAYLGCLFVALIPVDASARTLRWFGTLTIAGMTMIGIEGLRKFTLLLSGNLLERYTENGQYPQGTSLVIDYNFYALAHIVALLFIVERFVGSRSLVARAILFSVATISVANIGLSGSRRGLLVLGIGVVAGMIIAARGGSRFAVAATRARIGKLHLRNLAIVAAVGTGLLFVPRLSIDQLPEFDRLITRAETLATLIDSDSRNGSALSDRTVRWQEAYRQIDGFGAGRVWIGDGFSYHRSIAWATRTPDVDYPHNIFLSMWLSNGLFGLALCAAFLSYVAFMSWRIKGDAPILAWMFALMLIYVNTSGDQFFSLKPFPIITMLIYFVFRQRQTVNGSTHLATTVPFRPELLSAVS